MKKNTLTLFILLIFSSLYTFSQPGTGTKWTPDGLGFYEEKDNAIVKYLLETKEYKEVIPSSAFRYGSENKTLEIKNFQFTPNESHLLIFTNSQKVWRYETRGDYWILDKKTGKLSQLGKSLPEASLMFAKISPDGKKAAYVSLRNIYVEDLNSGSIKALTSSVGKPKLINGTFDWAYEEEFSCYDGFRWSPDSKKIAYWQIDATDIKDFNLINNTDAIYSKVVPIEYPKVGQDPSACSIGVVDIKKGKTIWMQVPGDKKQHYIPRMEWTENNDELILQQLDRKQQVSKLYYANTKQELQIWFMRKAIKMLGWMYEPSGTKTILQVGNG